MSLLPDPAPDDTRATRRFSDLSAPDARSCAGCTVARIVAGERPGRPVVCRDCGCEHEASRRVALAPPTARTSRPSRRAPRPHDGGDGSRAVNAFIADVLDWQRSIERVELAATGGRSPSAALIETGELGILGSGCRGTKGVGRKLAEGHDVRGADPVGAARYRACGRAEQATIDAVIADGQGLVLVSVPLGRATLELGLEQRVGLRLASDRDLRAWLAKIARGDTAPARVGLGSVGEKALRAASAAWWAGVGEGAAAAAKGAVTG